MKRSEPIISAYPVPALLCLALLFSALPQSAYCVVSSGADYELLSSGIDNGGGTYAAGGEYLAKGSVAQVHLPENTGVVSGGDYDNRAGFYNPPYLTYQRGLPVVLNSASGDFTVSIPANSIDKDVFDITMNKNPVSQPMNVDPGKIALASDKLAFNEGQWSQVNANSLAEMSIFDEQGYYDKPLANTGLLTMRYKDANDDGVVDGSNPAVRVETLNTWVLDETLNSWVQMPDAGTDRVLKTLSVHFGKPGVYALVGALDQAVGNVSAYPVPFRPNGPLAGSDPLARGQTGTEAQGITFANVPQSGRIEVYTLDGRLVRNMPIPDNLSSSSQTMRWDVKNSAGQKVASGVYIWRVVSGSNTKTGKLMVIW